MECGIKKGKLRLADDQDIRVQVLTTRRNGDTVIFLRVPASPHHRVVLIT